MVPDIFGEIHHNETTHNVGVADSNPISYFIFDPFCNLKWYFQVENIKKTQFSTSLSPQHPIWGCQMTMKLIEEMLYIEKIVYELYADLYVHTEHTQESIWK